jgi:hypothetical protein
MAHFESDEHISSTVWSTHPDPSVANLLIVDLRVINLCR